MICAISARRRGGGSSGGGGGTYTPPAGALRSGLNQDTQGWDVWASQNRFQSDVWLAINTSTNAFNGIPAANLDADRWPTSVPAGYTVIKRNITHKPAASQAMVYSMTWTGNFGGSGPQSTGSTTISNYDPVNRTCDIYEVGTIQAGNVWYATAPAALQYTIDSIDTTNGTYPKNIKIFPKGQSATGFDPAVMADTQAVTTNGPIRFMKDTGVEANEGLALGKNYGDPDDFGAAWGGGTQSAPHYKVTNANRTTYAGGEWFSNDAVVGTTPLNTPVNSGIPVEQAVAICNAYNRDLWWNEHWNAAPEVVTYNATYIRDNLSASLRAYIEIANEVWNPAYAVCGQAGNEAKAANRTDGHDLTTALAYAYGDRAARYAEKLVEYHGYYSTVFAGARTGGGSKPTLKRVCAWWNAQGGGIAQALLDYQPPNATGPLHTYVDAYASAPYYDPGNVDPSIFKNYDPSRGPQPIYDGWWADIENEMARVAGIRAICDARSLEYVTYEMGPGLFLDNDNSTCLALAKTVIRSPDVGQTVSHFMQRLEVASPGSSTCYYSNCGFIASNGNGGWGSKEYLLQDPSGGATPKWSALKDYASGIRKLFPLEGTLIVPIGAAAGTVVGYVRRRLIGSTITVNSPFSITDATATILQIKIADASAFTAAGSVNCVLSETGGTPSTTNTTTLGCKVTADTFFSPANSDSLFHIEGTNGLSVKHFDTNGGMHYAISTAACATGYLEYTMYNAGSGGQIGFTGLGLNRSSGLHWNTASLAYEQGGGLYRDGTKLAAWPTYANSDQIDLYLSPTAKLYTRINNGAWVGADGAGTVDPSSDTGGVDVSAWLSAIGGTAYAVLASNAPGFGATARFKNADFLHAKPTGATDWTVAPPDTSAPTLSSPVATVSGATSATVGATTNRNNGTLYYVVTTSSTAPTAAQIKAGQNNSGAAAIKSGSASITSVGAKSFSVTGLTTGTTYYAYLMHETTTIGNVSNVSSTASFAPVDLAAFDASVSNSSIVFSNGNLTVSNVGSETPVSAQVAHSKARALNSGSHEFTTTINVIDDSCTVGLVDASVDVTPSNTWIQGIDKSIGYLSNGNIYVDGGYPGGTQLLVATYGANDVITTRIVGNKVGFAKNGTWQNGFDPATGNNGIDMSTTAQGAGGITNAVPTVSLRNVTVTGDFTNW